KLGEIVGIYSLQPDKVIVNTLGYHHSGHNNEPNDCEKENDKAYQAQNSGVVCNGSNYADETRYQKEPTSGNLHAPAANMLSAQSHIDDCSFAYYSCHQCVNQNCHQC